MAEAATMAYFASHVNYERKSFIALARVVWADVGD
jgi:hypothetical protein